MPGDLLPPEFDDLERFVGEWALPTSAERNRKRLSSTMMAIRAFYDAVLARKNAAIAYLDQVTPQRYGEAEKRLLYLLLSLAEVAPAIEFFGQPAVVDGFDSARFLPVREPMD